MKIQKKKKILAGVGGVRGGGGRGRVGGGGGRGRVGGGGQGGCE